MIVVSHRGWWRTPDEKNSPLALSRSFDAGWGVETDLRDAGGRIVISHDMPSGGEQSLEQFLRLPRPPGLPLALNIKADGLATLVADALAAWGRDDDTFVFDMAVPDARAYYAAGVPVFARMSEVERDPPWLDRSAGVWLDAFDGEWWDSALIEGLSAGGKRVCIVSPELHGRPHLELWAQLREIRDIPGLMLCTDHPDVATDYFRS